MSMDNVIPKPAKYKYLIAFATILLALSSNNAYAAVGPNWIEQFGITWTFDKNLSTDGSGNTYQYGTFVNGDYWVVGPVVIISIDPPSTNVAGDIKNGSMINPVAADDQAYDSRSAGYNAGKNVALDVDSNNPLTITEASSLISCISLPERVAKLWIDQAAVLTILEEVPPANSFRPPYSGNDKSIRAVKDDIDWTKLSNLTKPAGALSYDDLVAHVQMDKGPWIVHWDSWWSTYIHPIQNMNWYGTGFATRTGEAALALNLDYTPAEKEPILINFLQLGIDFYGVIEAGDIANWVGMGGIFHGRKLPVVFAGVVLQDAGMLASLQKTGDYLDTSVDADGYPNPTGPGNPPADYIHFQEDDQTFYVTQFEYDITHDLVDDMPWTPDPRTPQPKFPYRLTDIGMPEWSRRNATKPWLSARNINTNYRSLNAVTYPATALAVHIMGMKDEWNRDAFFDYTDRWVDWIYGDPPSPPAPDEIDETQELYDALKKQPAAWVWNAWFDYRNDYPPVWPNQENDDIPPSILNVTVQLPVRVEFSEPLDQASATNISHYSITPGITIMEAVLDTDQRTVILTASDHQEGIEYTLIVNGVKDLAGNAVVNATFTYQYFGGLIGHWKLDEGVGTIANDSTTYNNQGTLAGPVWGNYLTFDGTNDYVEIPDAAHLDIQTQLTLSVWVNLNDHDNDWPKIIVKPYQANEDPWELYSLDLGHYGDTPRFIITDGSPGGSSGIAVHSGNNLNTNQWYHLVGTYDGSTMSLYVNGVSTATTNTNMQIGTNNMPLSIGGRLGTNSFNGLIRDVQIYNYALNSSEVADLYSQGSGQPNQSPTANAGQDKVEVDVDKNGSETVSLDATGSTDPDGTIQSYVWTEGANQIATGATPAVTLGVGIHTITLTVTDNQGAPDTDTVVVTVKQPPTANAGSDQPNVIDTDKNNSQQVTLNGSGSSDTDGTIQSFIWREGANQIATGLTPNVTLGVGIHTITLTVTDNDGLTDTDTVAVTVRQPPTANAGLDQPLVIDADWNGTENVTLDGSASTDNDGTIQSYQWHEGPILLATSVNPTVTLGVGDHSITLTVTDNHGLTDTDTVAISVKIPIQHVINATVVGAGGTIDPSGNVEVYEGADQSFTITPDNGYEIADVLVDGVSQGAISNYTFNNVESDHTISASFSLLSFTITAGASVNGSISPSGSIQKTYGQDQTFTITPDEGYKIAVVSVDGVNQGAISSYTFSNIDADHTISVGFVAITQSFTITATAGANGSITPSGSVQVTSGNEQAFAITADQGYQISDVLVDGVSVGAIATYAFSNVAADHTISAQFTVIGPSTITASCNEGGNIEPHGAVLVPSEQSQQFTITPDEGYNISNVVVDGSSQGAITEYTFDNVTADHTIYVSFTPNTFTITASAAKGGSITPSGEIDVQYGNHQTFTITTEPKYKIVHVRVDGSSVGAVTSYTFHNVTENHTLSVSFARDPHNITASATLGGRIELSGEVAVEDGADQMFHMYPDLGYTIANVVVDGVSQGQISSYPFQNVTQDHTISVSFARTISNSDDQTPPKLTNCSPRADAIQVPLNTLIMLHITDTQTGVDPNSITIRVGGQVIYANGASEYASEFGCCRCFGSKSDYAFTYQPAESFHLDQEVLVEVEAADYAGNWMTSNNSYSFRTEMRTFGGNRTVDLDNRIPKDYPTTATDSLGNIWVAWQTGLEPSRNLYVGKLRAGQTEFDPAVKITSLASDQCRPDLAVDHQDNICVVWQDKRRGNWDVYYRSSSDGITWSNEIPLIESVQDQAHQTAPQIVIDATNKTTVVWEDNRNGNGDIYGASSTDGFVSQNWFSVAINASDQRAPSMVADAAGGVYIMWTDRRNGTGDIYGASNLVGPWANVGIVSGPTEQKEPAIATEAAGSRLHLTWVDESNGNQDIYYARTISGFSQVPLAGVNLVDDSTDAVQSDPALAVTGTTGDDLKVYVCWQDERNVALGVEDQDIYFVEGAEEFGANVLVTNDDSGTGQIHPAIGMGADQEPYMVWVNTASGIAEIEYSGTMSLGPQVLAQKHIVAGEGGYVGTHPDQIDSVDDVAVVIPPGALWSDLNITIHEIVNPSEVSPPSVLDIIARYEFGPSSAQEFAKPVTITIPYAATDSASETVYWYNPQTDQLSQTGISGIELVVISDTLHAVRFQTTHFTQYLVAIESNDDDDGNDDGGGGGGCSMSSYRGGPGGIVGFFLPYIVLIMIVWALKKKDRIRTCR